MQRLNPRVFTCALMVLATLLALPVTLRGQDAQASPKSKPNVIFILADDLGWTDLACYGSNYYETPNLDRLASQGMRFTDGYTASPNCAPTRAALMSGQYNPRTGIYTVGGINRFDWQSRPLRPVDNITNLPKDKYTLGQAMKEAGYATAMFGKWHLGEDEGHHPSARGFDQAIVAGGQHYDFRTSPDVKYEKGTYLADFLTDNAVRFIKEKKDEPFFLYLPHFGVHAPYQAKPKLVERFKNKPVPEGSGHNNPVYAAMIYSIDESVGRIMQTLEDLNLTDNTLVIFSSDNGGVGGYVREGVKPLGKDTTDNAPLRGGKGMFYEGGVRVPFIFRWPGHIAAGSTSSTPIISVDLLPTLFELAQTRAPDDYPLDGKSVLPALTSKSDNSKLDREALYWHFPGYLGAGDDHWRTLPVGAIRKGDFKLLEFFEDGRLELYNLKEDLSQKTNLADQDPTRAQEMQSELAAWRQSIGAKMPTKNTPQEVKKGGKKKQRRNQGDDDDE